VRLVPYAVLVATLASLPLRAQSPVDSSLQTYIDGIKAIDNHAHPLLPPEPGVPPDMDNDALPLTGIPDFPLPYGFEPSNPRWIVPWRALYGYQYDDESDAHVHELVAAKQALAQKEGDQLANWLLDRMGVERMLGNRVVMGRGLEPPRFRWVAFVDALLFPLDVSGEAAVTPDRRVLYPREARLLRRYLGDINVATLPGTLDQYLSTVVEPTLDRMKRQGAVAYKFEIGYLRPLHFGDPPHDSAAAVYARYVHGGVPTHAEYTTLEDYLFRTIARDAGERGEPVHIHCLAFFGGYYPAAGSQPLQLESVFDDSTLRQTRFVLLHGGWPYVDQTLAVMEKPNVYADISMMTQLLSPQTLAGVLRMWLEEFPGKVLYGSDAYAVSNDDPVGWGDGGWVAVHTARRALGIALTGMMRDGTITRGRAQQLALMVLRDNALGLYHFGAVSAKN
jgi:uncharacterized protein